MNANERFYKDEDETGSWIRDRETWQKLKTETDCINKLNEIHDELCELTFDFNMKCLEINILQKEKEELKKELFEVSKEYLWASSDDVDRILYYDEEVEELRKEIFG